MIEEAIGWGAVAAYLLVLGVLLAFVRPGPTAWSGPCLYAGALISAVGFSQPARATWTSSPPSGQRGLAIAYRTCQSLHRPFHRQPRPGSFSQRPGPCPRVLPRRGFRNSWCWVSVIVSIRDPARPAGWRSSFQTRRRIRFRRHDMERRVPRGRFTYSGCSS